MEHICIICAIPQEIEPILRRFSPKKVANSSGFPVWQFQAFGNNITLLRSGIGIIKARKAAAAAAVLNPQMIISAGFCGALSPDTSIGEIFVAHSLFSYASGSITAEIVADPDLAAKIGKGAKKGTFITVAEITEKACLTSLFPATASAVLIEMESAAIAEVCRAHDIKFAAIRSVSDTAESDPCALFRRISNQDLSINIAKLLLSLIKKPQTLPALLALAKNSRIAGRSLAGAIEQALDRIP